MAYVIADNIISPLGKTSEENYLSVKAGKSMLYAFRPGSCGVQDGFCASLMRDEALTSEELVPTSRFPHVFSLKNSFERLAYASAQKAMMQAGIDVAQHRIVFILSTTKGAVEELTVENSNPCNSSENSDRQVFLGTTALHIAKALGISSKPITVCNACISGLSALILANRLLDADAYDYAVVCGADNPRRFIISGFQSLKALSTEPCRPFDMERCGLNLGEAAATIILGKESKMDKVELGKACSISPHFWQIGQGFIKNDAFHISAPSKTSEGLYACLQETLQGVKPDDIGFVNTHGTATLFNDQMESVAIQRKGLSELPANALKGYFGHTLGAAGILETILSMKAADEHIIIGTRGFEELGVSGKMNISAANRSLEKPTFVKMLSGFGGCNATLFASREVGVLANHGNLSHLVRSHHVQITTNSVMVDGKSLEIKGKTDDASMLTAIYKQYVGGYPKYYKMDGLSRLGFIASELLLKAENDSLLEESGSDVPSLPQHPFDRAVILFNRSSSIDSDKKYLASIGDKNGYFPSPSIFVYTLPNIVTGEIAIRHGYHGETSFYVLAEKDEEQMQEILQTAFMDAQTQSALTGWLDYEDATHFEADLYIIIEKYKSVKV